MSKMSELCIYFPTAALNKGAIHAQLNVRECVLDILATGFRYLLQH